MAESGSGYASSASSSVLAFLKIGRVEAFGELAINRREDVTGFRAALLTAKRPRCAQTPNVRDERRNARWYRAVIRYPRRSARATLISANPERPEMMGESIAQAIYWKASHFRVWCALHRLCGHDGAGPSISDASRIAELIDRVPDRNAQLGCPVHLPLSR